MPPGSPVSTPLCAADIIVALSTSCSKFPEKLLLFRKAANLNFKHAQIHGMLSYSINFGPNKRFPSKEVNVVCSS